MPAQLNEKDTEILNRICAKEERTLTPNDIRILKARSAYLGRRSRAKFAEVLGADVPQEEEVEDPNFVEDEELEQQVRDAGVWAEGMTRDEMIVAIQTANGPDGVKVPEKEEAVETPYKELQRTAHGLGLKFIGVPRKRLEASIKELQAK